jgi:hypothetical protein
MATRQSGAWRGQRASERDDARPSVVSHASDRSLIAPAELYVKIGLISPSAPSGDELALRSRTKSA